MVLKCLGSGSSGNCYILEASNSDKLIIECGVTFRTIKQALKFNLQGVIGCLVSHRHQDHSKALHDVLKAGIRVLSIEDVFESQNVRNRAFCKTIVPLQGYMLGKFSIFVIDVAHDVPCVGFIIGHQEMGKLLFVTDTMMIEYKLPTLNHIMIEANYSDKILQENIDKGYIPAVMRERLLQSHMEIETCKNVLRVNDLTSVNEIILIHLSGNNSNPKEFIEDVKEVSGKPVYVASNGFEIPLNISPY